MTWLVARVGIVVVAAISCGCGNSVKDIGVLVNTAGVTKESAGTSPREAPGRDVLPGTLRTIRAGDLLGDDRPETIVESEERKSLEVRGENGQVAKVPFEDYIADFTVVPGNGEANGSLVVHTYPNSQGGSTFTVLGFPGARTLATWDEKPPASQGVHAGAWNGSVAIFYLAGDTVVIRGPRGEAVARLPLRGATAFSRIYTVSLGGERTAAALSGDGYTPYHAVAIFDRDGTLLFHEQAPEHAFSVTSDGESAFRVETRSEVWRYQMASR